MESTLAGSLPKVSIIVPARNEEANLERCLRSLVLQRGISFEILVVNDDSTDRTRAIAESFTRVRQCPFFTNNHDLVDVHVLDAPPLPEHWVGKVNAVIAAESAARGEWLLITDADTEHLEGSLAAAVAEAEEHQVALLSYSPEQILTGLRQHLVMPLIFGELAFKYSPRRVSDPAFPDAAANGQYILVRSSVHRELGGFASVAPELLEDVAMARLYKQHGHKIRFRIGRGVVRTYMYESWEDLRLGWTKNLVLLFPNTRELARKRRREFVRLLLSLLLAVLFTVPCFLNSYWFWPIISFMYWFLAFIAFAGFYGRVSRAHFSFWPSLFSIFGLPIFAGLLNESAGAYEQGTVVWRGRTYHTGAETPSAASNSK